MVPGHCLSFIQSLKGQPSPCFSILLMASPYQCYISAAGWPSPSITSPNIVTGVVLKPLARPCIHLKAPSPASSSSFYLLPSLHLRRLDRSPHRQLRCAYLWRLDSTTSNCFNANYWSSLAYSVEGAYKPTKNFNKLSFLSGHWCWTSSYVTFLITLSLHV